MTKQNDKTYDWNHINNTLMGCGLNPRQILKVLENLPRGLKVYSWSQINEALMNAGWSARRILNVLTNIN